MSKKLMIVEAPSKAKHIQEYLGSEYIVKASVGHIRELPVPKNMTDTEKEKYGVYATDVNSANFDSLFKVSSDKKKVVAELKALAKTATEIVLATDDDAEGAAIAWHLLQELKPTVPTYRATWNEITEKAVREGLKNKQLIDAKKETPLDFFGPAKSALTRGTWDRLYGYKSSGYVQRTGTGKSSGRVQSPGARLVVEREEKRLAFKSVNYYSIWGEFDGTKAKLVEYEAHKIADGSKIDDEGNVKAGHTLITDDNLKDILASLKKKDYTISSVNSKPYRRTPPPPFTTSSALQSIGSKTRLSSKMLTSVFQELYASDAAVTYIRTVSIEASPDAIKAARLELKKQYGTHFVPAQERAHKDKKAGNSGHECIRNVLDDKSGLLVNKKFSDAQKQNVFDLIRLRFLASQSIDCEGLTWTALIDSTDKKAKFSASETEILEPGWTKIYELDDEVGA